MQLCVDFVDSRADEGLGCCKFSYPPKACIAMLNSERFAESDAIEEAVNTSIPSGSA